MCMCNESLSINNTINCLLFIPVCLLKLLLFWSQKLLCDVFKLVICSSFPLSFKTCISLYISETRVLINMKTYPLKHNTAMQEWFIGLKVIDDCLITAMDTQRYLSKDSWDVSNFFVRMGWTHLDISLVTPSKGFLSHACNL